MSDARTDPVLFNVFNVSQLAVLYAYGAIDDPSVGDPTKIILLTAPPAPPAHTASRAIMPPRLCATIFTFDAYVTGRTSFTIHAPNCTAKTFADCCKLLYGKDTNVG